MEIKGVAAVVAVAHGIVSKFHTAAAQVCVPSVITRTPRTFTTMPALTFEKGTIKPV